LSVSEVIQMIASDY